MVEWGVENWKENQAGRYKLAEYTFDICRLCQKLLITGEISQTERTQ